MRRKAVREGGKWRDPRRLGGRCLVLSKERRAWMGRWKLAVSRAQRRRKKRYCRRMGWWVRVLLFVGGPVSDAGVVALSPSARDGRRGGGGSGDEGVAFSMRAQVR